MTLWEVTLLAVVQGLTEFLPVSSSGHLALVEHWLQIPSAQRLPVSVLLHLGTWLALIVYFRRDLVLMVRGIVSNDLRGRHLLACVLLANGATAVLALSLQKAVEHAFASPRFVALFWGLTALLLFTSEAWSNRPGQTDRPLDWRVALAVGLAQGLAVFPGLSRSGTTIATGLFCGLAREAAGRFAFLVGIPAILGANLVEARDISTLPASYGALAFGVVAAFVVGYLSITWTLAAVRNARLRWFGVYCLIAALFALTTAPSAVFVAKVVCR